ncbi:SIR2 family protein [Oceanobacillus sp. M65]|uniref:SIR2 family protein n=1 Tax=Oceanobacillus sp. M65 TaxID=3457435 RepID=UPI003FCD633B
MGKPTNLPNFNDLTINIARGSGKIFDSYKDTPERFLGELEKEDVPVQKLASDQLSEYNLHPNQYHKNLVELFPKNDIKIVTTNYDLMFEDICKGLNINTNKYTNPAFPRGDNFSGIVHLHGIVGDFQHMVLTDSDFGRAYMLYGETSRFLSQVFNSDYTVLFIGYSYNDTVLRYFTRALPDLSGEKRYIFSNEKEKVSHEVLGLTPIIYELGDYENLYNTIKKIGDFSNRNSSSWDEIITKISSSKVSEIDLTTSGEIEHVFSKKYLLEQFLDKIDGADWFYYLHENNYFSFLFTKNDLLQSEVLIINWILDKFVNSDCEEIISILIKHNTEVNSHFKSLVLRALSNKPVNIEALQKLLNLISLDEVDDHTIYSLIKKLSSYKTFNKVITKLFQEVLKFEYSFVKPYFGIEENQYNVQVNVKTELIRRIWELIKKKEIHLESLADTITEELTNLESKSILGEVEYNFSPYNSFLDESGYIDDKTTYIKFFINLLMKLSTTNSNFIEKWIYRHINSNLSILRRISIYLISYLENVPSEDKLYFVNKKVGIFCFIEKEEVFSTIKTEFPKLTLEQQNAFIKYIMDYNFKNESNTEEQSFKRSSNYSKFNMLIWLKRLDVENEEIDNSIAKIKKVYPEFGERDYPDRNIGPIESGFANENIQISTKDFLENDIDDYFSDLLNYEGDGFEKPNRDAILRIASKAIEEKINLGLELSIKLLDIGNHENDLWKYILQGFEKHAIDSNKFVQINNILNSKIIKNFTIDVARVLLKYSEKIIVDDYNQYKNEICVLIDSILKYSKPYEGNSDISWVDKAMNTSYGVATELVINFILLLNKNRNKSDYFIDEELKKYIDKIIDKQEAGEAHTVLYIYLEHLNVLDIQWTDEKLIPNFNSKDEDKFNISWQGYLFNSSFNPETCNKLSDAFLFTIKNVNRIDHSKLRETFIRVYTLMCIDVVEDPLLEYIPYLYKHSNEFVKDFYSYLVYTLKSREIKNKESIWKKWLEKFIHNRINNIPIPYNTDETNWILSILLEYDFLFDKVRNIIASMEKEIKSPINVLYELNDIDINDENNNIIQLILTFCLESIFEDNEDMIDSLSRELVDDILASIFDKGYDLNINLVEISSSLNVEISK